MSVTPLRLKAETGEAAIYQIVRTMDVEVRYLLLGQALKRIKKFAEEFDSDADPKVLAAVVERDLAQDTNQAFCLIIAVRGLKVIGHILASAEWYFGKKYVYVTQLDIRGSGLTPEETKFGFDLLKTWAKSQGALGIRAGAASDAHVRLYKSRFGLAPLRTMMKGDL